MTNMSPVLSLMKDSGTYFSISHLSSLKVFGFGNRLNYMDYVLPASLHLEV